LGLNFENAAGDENELLFASAGRHDSNCAWLDPGDQRRMARVDAELARLARQHYKLRFAGEDLFFRANHIDMDRWIRHRALSYFSVFAFSCASSMVPTM
jgi:hypothetical protein